MDPKQSVSVCVDQVASQYRVTKLRIHLKFDNFVHVNDDMLVRRPIPNHLFDTVECFPKAKITDQHPEQYNLVSRP